MKKAFFFDRDGVLNQTLLRKNSYGNYKNKWPVNSKEFRLIQNAKYVIDYIKNLMYIPIIVTNQRGVYEGEMTLRDYEDITKKLCDGLGLERAQVFECLHKNNPIECACRKPRSGLFLMAKGLYDLDLQNSWMVGDSCSDIEAAMNAGVENIIFLKLHSLEGIRIDNEKEEEEIAEKRLNITYKIDDLIEIIKLV